jgi:hypothetical protein
MVFTRSENWRFGEASRFNYYRLLQPIRNVPFSGADANC